MLEGDELGFTWLCDSFCWGGDLSEAMTNPQAQEKQKERKKKEKRKRDPADDERGETSYDAPPK